MDYIKSLMEDVIPEIERQKEALLLEQLNELVKRNLLVIEQTQPILVRDECSDGVVLRQSVRLVLKDQEYIQQLEKENKELKEYKEKVKGLLNG